MNREFAQEAAELFRGKLTRKDQKARRWEELAEAKLEFLQRKTKFLRKVHEVKMQQMREEHSLKMKLLHLEIELRTKQLNNLLNENSLENRVADLLNDD
ncbi:hypothetical protein HHI36_022744 [Cryptolaemus montrouzieri]|uniref:Uncharacterized protein n=1 Tax=Cryptolaemus montrouzieri TaxID=559131 RepID=A0ABD2N0Q2_9CUCU